MLGQDPDVEALIAASPELAPSARQTLRRVAGTFGPLRTGAGSSPASANALPFTELGPYKLLARIGEGGMGVVYLAEHGFLARRVALKVIRPELAFSPGTRQRFQREAMRIAKLQHENVVRVYDAGEHEGVAFLAMEFVEGQGLDERLQQARRGGEPLDVISAVRHARDIARALECAHSAGIIHRDVKPSNVRITPDGRALLLDFGLSLGTDSASLSSASLFRGTPQYASPEQIEPGSTEIDARTDVYSLGTLLYECLTGHPPFESARMAQLFHQILASDPPEPHRENERVDPALSDLVMRAMAKRREERFASAGEMARALEDWLRSAATGAPAARRRRSGLGLRVGAALVIALGIAAWLVFRGAGGDETAVARATQPGAATNPRRTTLLFGDASRAFDQRLSQWAALVGDGTFGADEDGPGVLGISVAGISAEPYALSGADGCVRGRIEAIAPAPGVRTVAAGAGLELSDGRMLALLLVPATDGDELCVCELVRQGGTHLVRGPALGSARLAARAGAPLSFRLRWIGTQLRFEWGDAGAFEVPTRAVGDAHPSRFLLVVEKGSARFDECTLEES